jgi:predicted nucleic acid-binding protein
LALFFLDTSALVKLYVREAGTDQVLDLADDTAHDIALLSITAVELRSAVRRRQRENDISDEDAEQINEAFAADLKTRFLRQPITEGLVQVALGIVDRHALRAYDALQLAGCLSLRTGSAEVQPIFVCADRVLEAAARAEGLSTLVPSD